MKIKFLFYIVFFCCSIGFGQLQSYTYKTPLKGIKDSWHQLHIPNEIFSATQQNLSDIRIYGITETDTIEVPYLLKVQRHKTTKTPVPFENLNFSQKKNTYYYTYKLSQEETINRIYLDFEQLNFDWRARLEGGQQLGDWHTIIENTRLVGIKTNEAAYKHTTLSFSKSTYKYYRIAIQSSEKPLLKKAHIFMDKTESAHFNTFNTFKMETSEKNKQSTIDIQLEERVPISYLKLEIADTIQYVRPMQLEYVSDSIQTEKGERYLYTSLGSFTAASISENTFTFRSVLANKIRVTLKNYDNQPLQIESVKIKGYLHTLLARFSHPANYYLVFGNKKTDAPIYDITQIKTPALKSVPLLSIGEIEAIGQPVSNEISPLFENEWWLWIIMSLLMVALGYFTIQMMRQKI